MHVLGSEIITGGLQCEAKSMDLGACFSLQVIIALMAIARQMPYSFTKTQNNEIALGPHFTTCLYCTIVLKVKHALHQITLEPKGNCLLGLENQYIHQKWLLF